MPNSVPIAYADGVLLVSVDGFVATVVADMEVLPAGAVVSKEDVIHALETYRQQVHQAYRDSEDEPE